MFAAAHERQFLRARVFHIHRDIPETLGNPPETD